MICRTNEKARAIPGFFLLLPAQADAASFIAEQLVERITQPEVLQIFRIIQSIALLELNGTCFKLSHLLQLKLLRKRKAD